MGRNDSEPPPVPLLNAVLATGTDLLDLTPAVHAYYRTHQGDDLLRYWWDGHPTPEGHRLIADQLMDRVRSALP